MANDQEKFWQGWDGYEYQARNAGSLVGSVLSNITLFARALPPDINTVIEFGAGVGNNLRAINTLLPAAQLAAVEINPGAAKALLKITPWVYEQSMLDWTNPEPALACKRWDLAFTKGVLIHIAPADLPRAYVALYNASGRYVLLCEYFCPTPRMITYRGEDNRLWARDFAGEMLEAYTDLWLVGYGFVSRRDPNPQDDLTWWLMEKQQ